MIAKYPASSKVVFKPKDLETKKNNLLKAMKENIEIRRANSADPTSIALLGRVT
jgi:hypothetical protein